MARPIRLEPIAKRPVPRTLNPDSGVYAVVRPREETMTAYATHDAKNLLGALTSNVQFLRETVRTGANPTDVLGALDDLEACAQRLCGIMQQALEPKAAVQSFTLRKMPVNVLTVVQSVYQQMRHQAAMSDVLLEVRVQSDAIAMLDVPMMERVLSNLVDNALRFTPRGKMVRIACAVEGDKVELTVTDQGPGIEGGNGDRIFEPYFTTSHRGDPGESPHAGLGLSFCRTIARMHGGDVRAESARAAGNEHNGSRFVVSLPLA